MGKYPRHLFIFIGLIILGCAALQETEKQEPSYRWSSFFNHDCGPLMQFKMTSENDAVLNYRCSGDLIISQNARKHQQQGEVGLWAASDLTPEQLYRLSNSKCRAALIYLGSAHATVNFPCALIHLTVSCDITGREKINSETVIELKPTKVLIAYGDGTQEFRVEEDRLVPLGPFKPFNAPRPSFPVTQKSLSDTTVSAR